MKAFFTLLSLLFISWTGFSQSSYFQQKVRYEINVTLDDQAHTLSGNEKVAYTNNAPNALDTIYFHLWGNAYKNRETAFAKQQLKNRSTRFYFAEKKDLGGYNEIDFKVDGKSITWMYHPEHIDIAILVLPRPLQNKETLEIEIPFSLKIPASFSRLGHVGTSYQMTQWYPKPAVYDHKGWHPMPYLNQGEFYSEFGSFDVTLTLPKNYVIAASGTLETANEKAFLIERQNATKKKMESGFDDSLEFPESSKEMKTIRYTAENVHDFAWFADKRFHVLKEEVRLPSGKWVDAWAFFTNQEADLWTKGAFYVGRALQFYSEHVGEYPWPQATAVQSALSAGAGMEYPMITVIGKSGSAKSLDEVITHEVGHNWFYGILASNERDHPWMDEGMNSYYEQRYMNLYYDDPSPFDLPGFIKRTSPMGVIDLAMLFQQRRHRDQAPETHSADFRSINYGLDVYTKTAKSMALMEEYLGQEPFDNLMQNYYDTWKFQHPYPENFEALLKNTYKPTNWFMDELIATNKTTDYMLEEYEKNETGFLLEIENKGETTIPVQIQAIKDGAVVKSIWQDGFEDETEVQFVIGDTIDLIALDYNFNSFDINRKNDQLKINKSLPAFEPLDAQFGIGLENPRVSRFNWLPALGWNNYDKFMLGLALYSTPLPTHRFEYTLVPMFGFGSNQLVGMANLKYQHFFRTGPFDKFTLQLDARRFSFDYSESYDEHDYYSKLAPKVTLSFRPNSPTSFISQEISFRSVNIFQDQVVGINAAQGLFERNESGYSIQELQYRLGNSNIISPSLLKANLQIGEEFTKVFLNWNQSFLYNKKGKKFQYRIFAGWMNDKTTRLDGPYVPFQLNGISSSTFQRDYMFDEVHLGRSESSGFLSHQIFNQDAALKTIAVLPASNDWIVGAGVRSGLPNPLPIEPYFDFAFIPIDEAGGTTDVQLFYSGGIAVSILPNILEVYFPLLESTDITESAAYINRPGFFQRVSFQLNLKGLNPGNIVEGIPGL